MEEAYGDYGWIAPTYFIAERGIEAMRELAGDHVRFSGRNPVKAEFVGAHGPSRILFLSADNPESILGLGFKGIVIDEAARTERPRLVLRPAHTRQGPRRDRLRQLPLPEQLQPVLPGRGMGGSTANAAGGRIPAGILGGVY